MSRFNYPIPSKGKIKAKIFLIIFKALYNYKNTIYTLNKIKNNSKINPTWLLQNFVLVRVLYMLLCSFCICSSTLNFFKIFPNKKFFKFTWLEKQISTHLLSLHLKLKKIIFKIKVKIYNRKIEKLWQPDSL